MSVFVLDRKGRPLMPCSEKRARKLLESGRARVHKLFPFGIRLVDRLVEDSVFQPLRLSLDPGSKTTGLAVCRVAETVDVTTGEIQPTMHIQFLMELVHRGAAIKKSLGARAAMRRRRRGNLRYRAPRFSNRPKPKGWLAPSLNHRVETTMTQVKRLCRLAPITHLAQELVRFDMQKMQNPEVSGAEYQQGTLQGYEVREYLLEKFNRTCAYCDATDVPLQMEHIHPKASGGTNRISNLTLACQACNQKKGAHDIKDFLGKDPKRLAKLLKQAKAPLRDAAAVNTTRWTLFNALKQTSLPVETGTGGQTKYNRCRLSIPKTHALDAACVGQVQSVHKTNAPMLRVTCTGRGSRSKTRLDKYGFPRTYLTDQKTVFGFKTGDMVIANVPKGVKKGTHQGRVAIRLTGNFNIQTGVAGAATVQGISYKHCRITQRADGYGYSHVAQTRKECGNKGCASHTALSIPGLKAEVSRVIQMNYGQWPPYVSVAERRAKAEKAAAKAKKAGATLTPIAPFRGAIAKTFWGKAWCDNLERYSDYESRLPRGRTYVRNGSVIDLQITPGEVRAKVMGSSLYTVTASVTAVPEKQWKTICTDCSGSIDSLVELLQGKLSNAVMERICKPGSGLFPSPKEISFECSCPDWAGMCKHVAAVLYGVGTRLDEQPEVLFTLRRVDAKDLVQQAEAGLQPSKKRMASGKVLDDALLADVFGLEMADVPMPVKKANSTPRKAPTAAKTVAAKKTATRKVAAAETKVKKPSPATPKAPTVAVKRARAQSAKKKPG